MGGQCAAPELSASRLVRWPNEAEVWPSRGTRFIKPLPLVDAALLWLVIAKSLDASSPPATDNQRNISTVQNCTVPGAPFRRTPRRSDSIRFELRLKPHPAYATNARVIELITHLRVVSRERVSNSRSETKRNAVLVSATRTLQ